MVSQKVEKPVIATPDLIRGKQSPIWQEYWGLLRRFTPRNDELGEFRGEIIEDQKINLH
jgi:hypothetical protein